MTAYQVLHRAAKAKSGDSVLMHGAAGRVGIAALELGALAGLRLYGTASARDRAKVGALGAVAIDYRNEDFVARVREEAGGVDVVVDSLGGPISLRSFRALRPGRRLVVFGRYSTLSHGRKDRRAVIEWYAAIAAMWLWDKLSPRRKVLAYHVQKYRDRATRRPGAVGGEPMDPEWFREDFGTLIELLRRGEIHPIPAERLRLPRRATPTSCSKARRRRESSCSCPKPKRPAERRCGLSGIPVVGRSDQWKATLSATMPSPTARSRAVDHTRPISRLWPIWPALHPQPPSATTASHTDSVSAVAVLITPSPAKPNNTSGHPVTAATGQAPAASRRRPAGPGTRPSRMRSATEPAYTWAKKSTNDVPATVSAAAAAERSRSLSTARTLSITMVP
jgi:hypothetical protein